MNKAVQDEDIPVKKLKENIEYFAEYICFNLAKQYVHQNSQCLSNLLTSHLILNQVPEIKRIITGQSASYLLSQKCLKNIFVDNFQITLIIFFQNFSRYSPQHCLLLMIDKRKNAVYKVLGTLLTDLSKAFDCKCHDLLVAKFNAYDLLFLL